MKKQILFTILLFVGIVTAFGQVAIGTNVPNATSLLDLTGTDKGFLPPRMTAIQRDAIPTPAEGLVIYNTTERCLNFRSSTAWVSMCNTSSGLRSGKSENKLDETSN